MNVPKKLFLYYLYMTYIVDICILSIVNISPLTNLIVLLQTVKYFIKST